MDQNDGCRDHVFRLFEYLVEGIHAFPVHRDAFFFVDGSLSRDHPILIRRGAYGAFQRIDFGTGGITAAPVFAKIAEPVARYLDVRPLDAAEMVYYQKVLEGEP